MGKIKSNASSRVMALGDITKENICDIIKLIYDANDEDRNKPPKKRQPIKIIVNSSGGEVYDGLALIDVIDRSITPVHTVGFGAVMSMALIVYVSGHYRLSGKNTTFMYHETAYNTEGKIKFHKQELKEAERTDKICDQYILKRTRLTTQQLANMRNTQGDWYFDSAIAYQHGIVNEILK